MHILWNFPQFTSNSLETLCPWSCKILWHLWLIISMGAPKPPHMSLFHPLVPPQQESPRSQSKTDYHRSLASYFDTQMALCFLYKLQEGSGLLVLQERGLILHIIEWKSRFNFVSLYSVENYMNQPEFPLHMKYKPFTICRYMTHFMAM